MKHFCNAFLSAKLTCTKKRNGGELVAGTALICSTAPSKSPSSHTPHSSTSCANQRHVRCSTTTARSTRSCPESGASALFNIHRRGSCLKHRCIRHQASTPADELTTPGALHRHRRSRHELCRPRPAIGPNLAGSNHYMYMYILPSRRPGIGAFPALRRRGPLTPTAPAERWCRTSPTPRSARWKRICLPSVVRSAVTAATHPLLTHARLSVGREQLGPAGHQWDSVERARRQLLGSAGQRVRSCRARSGQCAAPSVPHLCNRVADALSSVQTRPRRQLPASVEQLNEALRARAPRWGLPLLDMVTSS